MSRRGRVPIGTALGPVFDYEWLTASRRWQGYALRSLFVLGLLAALAFTWLGRREVWAAASIRGLARIGELFYVAAVGTQLTLVLLAAPAATAGAICLDRARGTLTHLLVTDLTDREIVLGKLAARLVPVLGLVGCTLPVMAILTLLGGVDPDALLGALAVTLGVAVLGCCLALAFSLLASKTHEALLGTYAVWGLWLLATPMIGEINRATGWAWAVPPRVADPFALAFAPYWWPGRVGPGDYLRFLAATGTLSVLLAAASVLRLRSASDRADVPGAGRRGRRFGTFLGGLWRRLDLTRRLPGPSLDFNPVLWREWHRNRPSRWARVVGVLYVALAVIFSLVAIFGSGGPIVPAWVNGLQVSIGLLLLSVTAATSLAEERVRGSLDVLLASPLSTREIVLGKWLGTFRLVPPLAILPGLVILGTPARDNREAVFVLTIAFVLASGAAITGLGLAMATWCSRLGRAVGLTVTLYVLVAVGWMFLVMITTQGRNSDGPMMGSPFYCVGEMTIDLYYHRSLDLGYFAWPISWTVAYALAAAALLAATLATFNRCLGRVEGGLPALVRRIPKPKEADPDWAAEEAIEAV